MALSVSLTSQQMQLSGSQLTSVWNGARHLGTKFTQAISQARLSKVLDPKEETTVDASAESVPLSNQSLVDEVVVKSASVYPHWWESHVSESSFQLNIDRSHTLLDFHTQQVCSAVLGRRRRTFSPALVNDVIHQQIRGFKTKRSEASGLAGRRQLGRIEPMRVEVNNGSIEQESSAHHMAILANEKEKKIGLAKFLSRENLTPDDEKAVKISFADGFHTGSDFRVVKDGLMRARGSLLTTHAFLEGYKCYAAATTGRETVPESSWHKLWSMMGRALVLLPILITIWIFQNSNVSVKKVSFMNGGQFEVNPETVTITFDDVRGLAEAKSELANIVDFLKNPSKYTDLGAKLPNGCLLVGPPGVGKTLLAKAVAGEAGVPFFQASGAEFDEVYVGTGAKRVRQLFQSAKAKAPCVIFIDEIDSVGSKRTSSELHPYANQTVNQLLTEMDGFEANVGVIVLGATNKKTNLDKALLRPGRFDVEVAISVPDLNERKEILDLYLPKIVTDGKVDVSTIAKLTIGCTGADLNNICNHAALKAATDGEYVVTMDHIEFAIDKVRMGPQKKRLISPQVNRYTAYHEAGHAVIQYFSKVKSSKLHKITILPRGQSLGMTHFIQEEKREFQYTKEEMLNDLDALMGGRVAEELTFGDDKVSSGAASDMQRASDIAQRMVSDYGFSDKVGLRVHSGDKVISERVKEEIDEEIKRVLAESYARAKKLLMSKQRQMNAIAEALLEYEELTYEDVKTIIEGGKLTNRRSKGRSDGGPPDKTHSDASKPTKTNSSQLKPIKL